jgi:hypothetical protein
MAYVNADFRLHFFLLRFPGFSAGYIKRTSSLTTLILTYENAAVKARQHQSLINFLTLSSNCSKVFIQERLFRNLSPCPLPLLREGGVKVREGDKGGEVNK